MKCHICSEAAIGQCQNCWKFYCLAHGDVFCLRCQESRSRPPSSSGLPSAGMHVVRQGAPPGPRPPGFMEAKVLRGVIAIGETRTADRAEISLLSLESYDDGFILRYRLLTHAPLTSPPAGLPHMPLVPTLLLNVKDDVGNEYRGGPGGWGGGDRLWQGEARLTPAVADEATSLEVRVEEIQWLSRSPSQRSRVQPGPWTFHIRLH
jgi:hypothetical protein